MKWFDIILMVISVFVVSLKVIKSFKPKKKEVNIGRSVQNNWK